MGAFAVDWINLGLRWFHLVVGIAWIGASFHFIWLDFSLRARERMNEGVSGTSWMVHGGGFYHVEKYGVAPATLPPDLHWFKWEAYLTFLSGFGLLVMQYYWNASAFLVDPAVLDMSGAEAVIISVLTLGAGWFAYDALCRSPLRDRTELLALSVFALIVGAAFVFTHVFSGRGAFIHVGAMVGTIMAANVFAVIIPNQKIITADLLAGRTPDPRYGKIGKQRSLHNNYLTLPVLLFMVSNHYAFLYSHPQSWLVVALIVLTGGLVRHFLNRVDAGDEPKTVAWALPAAAVAMAAAIVWTAPRGAAYPAGVTDADALKITQTHCAMCHAAKPTHEAFRGGEPPKGVMLDTVANIRRHAAQVNAQAVQGRAMPLGNETKMTDDERARLGAWLAQP
ncbi:cysteine desulfurase [Alsobacter metallidurans]|uniref:Cysteine desulfurase n=1 Tax=Alsobacter metallidurans TaxID=340221 RepID=A0A917I5S3_9HYPH|nr:urate hydroxylase PuuD [Alsobacter metallidurans]GGH14116.1 cysteine desulfurase [Alsobacter metallidurans]